MKHDKNNKSPIERYALPVIMAVAIINHLLTYFAYEWYAGIDSYSYDVCGLQLLTGQTFDIFPLIYRPPLVPVIKNILYLIFEGHPHILSLILHILGVMTVYLAYITGKKLGRTTALITGIALAANLKISFFFHFICSFTFYVPILILSAYYFIDWCKEPVNKNLIPLILVLCAALVTRTETILLLAIYIITGHICHKRWKQTLILLLTCGFFYNMTAFWYYKHFGYWGITKKTGWALSYRLLRPEDRLFDPEDGPASLAVKEYLARGWPEGNTDIRRNEYYMCGFNLAQAELGYKEADELWKRAFIEAVRARPWKFMKYTLLRTAGQLNLSRGGGMNHPESLYETESGHLWGFLSTQGKRSAEKNKFLKYWIPSLYMNEIESPLEWEREVLRARLRRLTGRKTDLPKAPENFRLSLNVFENQDKKIENLSCSNGIMAERKWNCLDLDRYFYLKYWSPRKNSRIALGILSVWDKLIMPGRTADIYLHRFMWLLALAGLIITHRKWVRCSLAGLLCFVVIHALNQAVFSDNFSGRFELYVWIFLLISFSSGFDELHALGYLGRFRARTAAALYTITGDPRNK